MKLAPARAHASGACHAAMHNGWGTCHREITRVSHRPWDDHSSLRLRPQFEILHDQAHVLLPKLRQLRLDFLESKFVEQPILQYTLELVTHILHVDIEAASRESAIHTNCTVVFEDEGVEEVSELASVVLAIHLHGQDCLIGRRRHLTVNRCGHSHWK